MKADAPSLSPITDWLESQMVELRRHETRIRAALEHAPGFTHSFDDVVVGVLRYQYRLWSWEKSCIISEIKAYPSGQRHYHLWLGAGDLDELLAAHDEVFEAARKDKCSHLTLTGRRGWERPLVKHGWSPLLVTFEREVPSDG
jgi:hypothetical protein